ncbi:hypothetical protein ACLB2K_036945 [Fragaria x ananassa]
MEDHSCIEEKPGTEEIFPEDVEPVMTDVDLSKLDKLVAQAVQMAGKKMNEESSLKNKGQQAEGVKKYVKKTKQIVETHSIERNVKLYKRGVEKRKEEEWEYDTPEGLKPTKRTKKEKQKVKNDIVIDGVNCNTNTWKLLDEKTIKVYLQMLKEKMEKKKVSVGFLDIECAAVVHEKKLKEFLAGGGGKQGEFKCNELDIKLSIINPLWSIFSKDLVFILIHHGVSHHYTLVMINNKDRCFYHLNSMLPPRKDYSADTNIQFQNAMGVVKHIMVFIKHVYDSIIYPLSQELDPEEWRENYGE